MFCRNCGREVPTDFKFCSHCGESTGTSSNVIKKLSSGENNFDKETMLHYLSMIISVIMILLTFSKWIKIKSWVINGDISTWKLCKIISDLSRYGEHEALSVIGPLLVCLMIAVISFNAYYIFKAYNIGKAYRIGVRIEDNDHIIYGYLAMTTTAIICGIFVIMAMIVSSLIEYDIVSVYFNEKAYYIIALACLNRFVLLPRLNSIIYDRKERNKVKNYNMELR